MLKPELEFELINDILWLLLLYIANLSTKKISFINITWLLKDVQSTLAIKLILGLAMGL